MKEGASAPSGRCPTRGGPKSAPGWRAKPRRDTDSDHLFTELDPFLGLAFPRDP